MGNNTYHTLIVGSGISGLSTAIFLNEEISKNSLLIDIKKNPENKPCGGILVEESIEFLKNNFKNIPKNVFSYPEYVNLVYMDFDNKVIVEDKRNLWNVNRIEFNRWLIGLAKKNISVNYGVRFNGILKKNGKYKVSLIDNSSNKKFFIESKNIIGADGCLSSVRSFVGKSIKNFYNAAQIWVRIESGRNKMNTSSIYFIYDKNISNLYSWVIPKNEYLIIGTALEPGTSLKKLEMLKRKLESFFSFKSKKIKTEAYVVTMASPENVLLGKNNIFLVGEAAGLISPSTAEGISFALRSGKYCAETLNEGKGVEEYKEKCKPLIDEIKEKYQKLKILQDPEKRLKLWERIGEVERL